MAKLHTQTGAFGKHCYGTRESARSSHSNRSNYHHTTVVYHCNTQDSFSSPSHTESITGATTATATNPLTGLTIQDENRTRIPSKAELQNMMICGTDKSFWDEQNERKCKYYKIDGNWVFESEDSNCALILKTNRCGQFEWQSLTETEAKELNEFKNRQITLEAQELDASNPEHNKLIASRLNYSADSVSKLGKVIFDRDDHSHPMLIRGNENDGYKFYIHDRKPDGNYDWLEINQDNYPRHLEALNTRYPLAPKPEPAPTTEPAPQPSPATTTAVVEPVAVTASREIEENLDGHALIIKEASPPGAYEEVPAVSVTIDYKKIQGKFISRADQSDFYFLQVKDLSNAPDLAQGITEAGFNQSINSAGLREIAIPRSRIQKPSTEESTPAEMPSVEETLPGVPNPVPTIVTPDFEPITREPVTLPEIPDELIPYQATTNWVKLVDQIWTGLQSNLANTTTTLVRPATEDFIKEHTPELLHEQKLQAKEYLFRVDNPDGSADLAEFAPYFNQVYISKKGEYTEATQEVSDLVREQIPLDVSIEEDRRDLTDFERELVGNPENYLKDYKQITEEMFNSQIPNETKIPAIQARPDTGLHILGITEGMRPVRLPWQTGKASYYTRDTHTGLYKHTKDEDGDDVLLYSGGKKKAENMQEQKTIIPKQLNSSGKWDDLIIVKSPEVQAVEKQWDNLRYLDEGVYANIEKRNCVYAYHSSTEDNTEPTFGGRDAQALKGLLLSYDFEGHLTNESVKTIKDRGHRILAQILSERRAELESDGRLENAINDEINQLKKEAEQLIENLAKYLKLQREGKGKRESFESSSTDINPVPKEEVPANQAILGMNMAIRFLEVNAYPNRDTSSTPLQIQRLSELVDAVTKQ